MKELYDIIKKASPVMLCIVAAAYFLKVSMEKLVDTKIEGMQKRIESIDKTSLGIKQTMRGAEREDLVDFRVALEKWEFSLQKVLTDYTMAPLSADAITNLYADDMKNYLEVRVSMVKACIYLRNEKLEEQLGNTILKIRNSYYPLIQQRLPGLIDLQTQLAPIQYKCDRFRDSGFTDMAYAPTAADLEKSKKLQADMTAQLKDFADNLIKEYQPIAEQLVELKGEINKYIYRRIEHTELDKD